MSRADYVRAAYRLVRLRAGTWAAQSFWPNGALCIEVRGSRDAVVRYARANWGHFNHTDEAEAFAEMFGAEPGPEGEGETAMAATRIEHAEKDCGRPATIPEADRMRRVLGAIQSALWASGCRFDPNKPWDADTVQDIAQAMITAGYGPRE